MSGLEDRLRQLILDHGPISIARYMALVLVHPSQGYYSQRDPLGAAGDFITAPEVSQLFGELLGLALVQHWLDLGRPCPVAVVELGPGRGTLMADALRAAGVVPGFLDAISVHLVETSPALRQRQEEVLSGVVVRWHADLATLPGDRPILLLANEFLDALPIRQFLRQAGRWCERLIGIDREGSFRFVVAPGATPLPTAETYGEDAAEGMLLEVGPAREALVEALALRLVDQGGVALLIDYGRDVANMTGDSFRAIRRHQAADPLCEPGKADLSAHVDFRALAAAAAESGAAAFGPVAQGEYLGRLGIAQRLGRLLEQATSGQKAALESGCRRLVAPDTMGELFKVMAITPPGGPIPPGFTEQDRRR